jgi:hypothetical protein
MTIDYSSADRVLELSFEKLANHAASVKFPARASLSRELTAVLKADSPQTLHLPHAARSLFATASVEMWHRSIHSFLYSVALTNSSPLWASVTGYYSSHFVMRAFAHSFGFFKSFAVGKVIQVILDGREFACSILPEKEKGEHAFYWKVVKRHPDFSTDPLFGFNSERDPRSDCSHRNFANYTDHINSFGPPSFPTTQSIAEIIRKISRINRHSVTSPDREDFPDLQNVQILAYQRLVTYREYMDKKLGDNKFWRTHRDPLWCKDLIRYYLQDDTTESLRDFSDQ